MLITLGDRSKYQKFDYPAGEMQVRILPHLVSEVESAKSITVVARIQAHADIIELALLRDCLGFNKTCKLILPYLPYSRADRAFVPGDCQGLLVFGRLLFAMSWDTVVTLDAHSHLQAVACCQVQDVAATPFIMQAVEEFARSGVSDKLTVLLPDAGAALRYKLPADVRGLSITTLHCEKKRDAATGKFMGFTVPELPPTSPILIVDDICDGGGTFLGIAAEITGTRPLGLYTTHSMYSQGQLKLRDKFCALYTTNSYNDAYPGLQAFDCIPVLLEHV